MNFSTDRDLLALEPSIFTDAPLAGQELLRADDAQIDGDTLTSASSDFEACGIDTGAVALVDGVPLAVAARVDAHTLTVSTAGSAPPMLPQQNENARRLVVRTCAPQARLTHDELLRMLGIDPDRPECSITDSAIVSRSLMRSLETLGTLERVFTAAASPQNAQPEFRAKAEHYASRYRRACLGAAVWLDTNHDGVADTLRHLGIVALLRR